MIPVLFIDQLRTADPGATMTFVAGGALKPVGGHILSHASATRMFLRKGVVTVLLRITPCNHTIPRTSGGTCCEACG